MRPTITLHLVIPSCVMKLVFLGIGFCLQSSCYYLSGFLRDPTRIGRRMVGPDPSGCGLVCSTKFVLPPVANT